MHFISTRNKSEALNFKEVTLKGLADDGGLYIPNKWPLFRTETFNNNMSFEEFAFVLIKGFVGNNIEDEK